MPALNGPRATRRIRKQPWREHPDLRITGGGQEADRKRSTRRVATGTWQARDAAALKKLLAELPAAPPTAGKLMRRGGSAIPATDEALPDRWTV